MTLAHRALGLWLLLAPSLAFAHSPIKSIDDFYGGLLHPLLVPSHLLGLLALGLLLGQQGLPAMRLGLPAFMFAVLAGLLATGNLQLNDGVLWLSGCALLCGLLVVLQLRLPAAACLLPAALFGFLLGLDSPSDELTGSSRWLALAGTALGASLGLLYIAGLCERLQQPWQRIGMRILGSWISASSVLVITLSSLGPADAADSAAEKLLPMMKAVTAPALAADKTEAANASLNLSL